jgi:(R,R)-butanediol dehydrogenase/meso-butanediol dehydrogenase/diacetyl reductase
MNQAAFYTGNKTFQLGDSPLVRPGPGEVRLKVAYCGVCGTDVHIYHGAMDHRVRIPQVIGHEVSAIVVELGSGVEGWTIGERVAVRPLQPGAPHAYDNGYTHIGKNLKFIGIDTPGGMQANWTTPAHTLHRLPPEASLEQGAMIEPLAVACHDIRLAELRAGERVVVIGGGPIGLMIALVARHLDAKVLLSEINPHRLALAQQLGLATVHAGEEDLPARVEHWSEGALADVVFEVSGAPAGAAVMTKLGRVRSRLVMVAIHSQPRPVDLFQFFWRELRLIGARVYEPEDFETAIALLAADVLPLDRLITEIAPLSAVREVFQTIDANPAGMKYLLRCNEPENLTI